jgi:hypothetical protein
MRVGLISLITIVGCAAAVGAAQKSTDDRTAPSMGAQKAPNEALLNSPLVPLAQLIDQTPDGGQVIELYKAAHTVRDVEVANEMQKVETEKPGSSRAKEDVNRLVLATHELGRLRVQAQEIAKSVESLGGSIRATSVSCVPTPVPPLFAERDAPSKVGVPASRPPSLSPRRVTKPTTTMAPRFSW